MKASTTRLKRTPPERSGPIRSRVVPRSRGDGGAPQDPIAAAGSAVFGALENGVRTAYAVIDEYMRRGQDAARAVFNNSERRGSMNNEDRGNFPGGFNPWSPLAMATEQWMMAMRAWMQAWSAMVPGAWQAPWMGAFAGNEPHSPAVSVKISSSRTAEVTVKLYPGHDLSLLVPEPLRAEGFAASSIESVTVDREPAEVRVTLNIGAEQPAGRYRGLIRRDTDKSVAGEMTVVVS